MLKKIAKFRQTLIPATLVIVVFNLQLTLGFTVDYF